MSRYDKSKTPESWLTPYQEYGRYAKNLQIADLESNREAHKLHAWHLEQQAKAKRKMKVFKALTFAANFIPFGGVATSVLAKVGMQSAGLAAKFLTKSLVKSMGKFVTSRFLAETAGFKPKKYHSEVKYRKDLLKHVNEQSKKLGVQKPKFGDAFVSALTSEFNESIIKPGMKAAKAINKNASATDIIKQQSKLFKQTFGFGEGNWKFKAPTEAVSSVSNIGDVVLENLNIEDVGKSVDYAVDYGGGTGEYNPYNNQTKSMYNSIINDLDKEGIIQSSPEFANLSLQHMPIEDVSKITRGSGYIGPEITAVEYDTSGITSANVMDPSSNVNVTGTEWQDQVDPTQTSAYTGTGWQENVDTTQTNTYTGTEWQENVDTQGGGDTPWYEGSQTETYTPWYENLTEEETSPGFDASVWNKDWRK